MAPLAETEALLTIAQVAITLVGFSGIVVVFGDRSRSAWSPEEYLRLYTLIKPSLTAFFCSFIPILLAPSLLDTDLTWRISNAILGLVHGVSFASFLRNPHKAKITMGQKINGLFGVITILAHFLAALGYLPWLAEIYLIGLLQQMWVAIFNFLLLLEPRIRSVSDKSD